MSIAEVETVAVDAPTHDENDPWHLSLNDTEEAKARAGLPYVTLCGLVRKPWRGTRLAYELSDIDRCAVCDVLDGAEL